MSGPKAWTLSCRRARFLVYLSHQSSAIQILCAGPETLEVKYQRAPVSRHPTFLSYPTKKITAVMNNGCLSYLGVG